MTSSAPTVPAQPQPTTRDRSARWRRQTGVAYLFVLPTILGLAIFYVVPVIASMLLGFAHWNALTPPRWAGFTNYTDLWVTPTFWAALRNTTIYILFVVPVSTALGLLAAILLNNAMRGVRIYRTLFFLPYIPSMVSIGIIWAWIMESRFGVLNYLLRMIGLEGPPWFSSTAWALPSLILIGIWRVTGYNMIVYLAGLQSLPHELLEAARIDGATDFQLIPRIIVPLLSPTTLFTLIIGIVNSYQVFELTYVTTQGGPGYATQTFPYYIYQLGFQFFQFGRASAVAYIFFLFVLVLTLGIFRSERHWVHY